MAAKCLVRLAGSSVSPFVLSDCVLPQSKGKSLILKSHYQQKWTHLASSAYFTLTYVCDHISPTGILKKINCNPNSLPFSSLPCSVLRASPNACARLRWCLDSRNGTTSPPPSWNLLAHHALARRNAWIFRAACSFLAAWIISKPTTNSVR